MPDRAESGAASQPEWAGPRLIACGVVLLVTISATAAIDPTRDVGVFLGLTAVASLAYLISLGLVAWGGRATNRVLVLCLLLAAAWRIPLFLGPPLLSTDIYRYVWDGRVQRLGHNPYVSAPADPALQHLHTPLTARTEHADLPTIYPPFAELVFRGIASIQESVFAFKLAQLLCEVAIVVLLLRWLRMARRNAWWVLAYAWHPLAAFEAAGSGHLGFLGVALLLGGAVALELRRGTTAAVVLALAVAVKFAPIVLALLVLRRLAWRDIAIGAALLLGLYAWFAVDAGGLALGSLGDYAERWRFNGPVFLRVEQLLGMKVALAAPVVGGLVAAWYTSRQPGLAKSATWAWPIAVTLALAPAIYRGTWSGCCRFSPCGRRPRSRSGR